MIKNNGMIDIDVLDINGDVARQAVNIIAKYCENTSCFSCAIKDWCKSFDMDDSMYHHKYTEEGEYRYEM